MKITRHFPEGPDICVAAHVPTNFTRMRDGGFRMILSCWNDGTPDLTVEFSPEECQCLRQMLEAMS